MTERGELFRRIDPHDRLEFARGAGKYRVVAYDFGAKFNILRMLADRGCDITVVPAQTPASEVLALKPDGVFLSNGPGDPEPCDYAIAATREFIARKLNAMRGPVRLFFASYVLRGNSRL